MSQTFRISNTKPQYNNDGKSFPSFMCYNANSNITNIRNNFIQILYATSSTITGSISSYQNLNNITIRLEIDDTNSYDKLFNAYHIEVILGSQTFYYFITSVRFITLNSLELVCELDYWLTYFHKLEFSRSAKIVRRHFDRVIPNSKEPVLNNLDHPIHNEDKFDLENTLFYNACNIYPIQIFGDNTSFSNTLRYTRSFFVGGIYKESWIINPSESNETSGNNLYLYNYMTNGTFIKTPHDDTFKSYIYSGKLMFYAFIVPSSSTDSQTYEFDEKNVSNSLGGIDSGCYIVPLNIDINTHPSTSIQEYFQFNNVPDGYTGNYSNEFANIFNWGSNNIISICASPVNYFQSSFDVVATSNQNPALKLKGVLTYASISVGNENEAIWFINANYNPKVENQPFGNNISLTMTDNILLQNDGEGETPEEYILPLTLLNSKASPKYDEAWDYSIEPKLLTSQFSNFEYTLLTKTLKLINETHLHFTNTGIYFYAKWSHIPAAHITAISCSIFPQHYYSSDNSVNTNIRKGLGMTENTIKAAADLQVPTTSSCWVNFFTQNKYGYISSLQRGKAEVKYAKSQEARTDSLAAAGLLGNWSQFGAAGSSISAAKQNVNIQESTYNQILAISRDKKREPRNLNDSQTNETFTYLTTLKTFYSIQIGTTLPGTTPENITVSLDAMTNMSFYTLGQKQLEIVSNYYHLHGYLYEQVVKINRSDFQTRIYFDYLQIENVITAINKSGGANKEVMTWFNNKFNKGIWLFHHTQLPNTNILNQPEINDFSKENWEILWFQVSKKNT